MSLRWPRFGKTTVACRAIDPHRYPLEPLLKAVNARGVPSGHNGTYGNVDASVTILAELVGVTPREVGRWKNKGLNWWAADRAAVLIGLLPHEVWPDWFDNVVLPEELWGSEWLEVA